MKKHRALLLTLSIAALPVSVMLSACSTTTNTSGQIILPSRLAQVQPGVTTRDEVRTLLGSPSTTGTLNDNRWYYITTTTESKVLRPNMLESREVVIIDFDQTGVVTALGKKTASDGKALEPTRAITKTAGQSLGVIEQALENLSFAPAMPDDND